MATLLTQTYNLNLIPGQNIVVVNAAAYDNSPRLIRFTMFNGAVAADISGWSARVEGTRQGTKAGFSTVCTVASPVVSFAITDAMTASSGKHQAAVVFYQGEERVASATFILNVAPAVLDESTPATEEDTTIYQQWIAANTSQIQTNANDIAVLKGRMDEFASLPPGSTEGNAELVDIRVGAGGETYPTAGDAVRNQITNLKTAVSNYITGTGKVSAQEFTWEQGAVRSSNGSNSDSTTRIRSIYAKMGNYIIYLKANEGYKFTIACYTGTTYQTYAGMYDGASFSTTATWRKEMAIGFDRDLYTRIVIAKDDDSAIDPSDASNLVMYAAVDKTFKMVNVPIESKAVGDEINEISARIIRVMQYNVGKFRWGYVNGLEEYGLTEAQYKEKLLNYKKLFGKYHPDILGLQECVMYMDKAQTHNTKNVLLDGVFSYVSPDSFYGTVQLETEICGCGAISDIDRLSVRDENDSYRTWFRLATLNVGTRKIRIASGALTSAATPQQRAEQLAYLIENDLKNYEYAIITSDLNSGYRYDETSGELIDNNSLSAVLASAANYDFFPCQAMDAYWGATVTYVHHAGVNPGNIYSCIDNILCKGNIKIRNFEVLTDEYNNLASDHIPVIADLYVY